MIGANFSVLFITTSADPMSQICGLNFFGFEAVIRVFDPWSTF